MSLRQPERVVFASHEVDRALPIARGEGPELMRGLWWMDGNPLPDEVISLHASSWDASMRRTRVAVYESSWTWHDNALSEGLYEAVLLARLTYHLQFDAALTTVCITPQLRGLARIPSWAATLTAKRVSEGLWLRYSGVLHGVLHTYALRRIVREDGTREPAYADYVARAPARCFTAASSTSWHSHC